MKYVVVMFLAVVSGCGIWGGYAPGFSGYTPPPPAYVPPTAYSTSGFGGGFGGGYFVPPPPPSDLAFVEGHGYPNQWRGPHLVRVVNNKDRYVRVRMDGADLSFTDLYAGQPLLPPHTEGHFYAPLLETDLRTGCERHHFEFEEYLAPNFDRPVRRSDTEHLFCVGWEEQRVNIGNPW